MQQHANPWSAAAAYEQYMGRWSRLLAQEFVSWLDVAPAHRWLDIGCGTGALTSAICAMSNPVSVIACDPADGFIEYARQHNPDSCASFVVAGAENFPIDPIGYDHITSLLALNFFPDPIAALRRMESCVRGGGVVSACVWDYGDGMQFIRHFWDAAAFVVPAAAQFDQAARFPICNADNLREAFHEAGLVDVQCEPLTVPTHFTDFRDYWGPFTAGTGVAPAFVSSLDHTTQTRLRETLQARLPMAANGSITLSARAWAVRARKTNRLAA